MTSAVSHRHIEVNGVGLHIAEQGEGPLVLLLHGFPECWYSWRHQFGPLAEAGYRVVAPDQRGYARSEQPDRIDAYTMLHLTGDVVGLIHALGARQAVVVGHDWGAPVAWSTALLRPDLVRGVAGLSVPPSPRGTLPPLTEMRRKLGDGFYQIHFQQPGVADAEFAADPAASFRRLLTAASGDNPSPVGVVSEGGATLATLPEPERLPSWLTEADIAVFTEEYARHGDKAFTGGLNWYRNIDRNWELMAPFDGRVIDLPALYVVGDRDLVMAFPGMDELLPALPGVLPGLHRSLVLPGCGHWTQQERPEEVNSALLDFLASLPKE
ncbi:alpha/beta fold hydrolase [Streptomyces orinoci]|uniref:Alpha/beta hydrolase n=1 Tax=Streptomyces orinoci TaxID=67339 RepID=A0ABV3JYZ8_STRON|nr:alpha/beta hydrolase [Streptomyces orinoci]